MLVSTEQSERDHNVFTQIEGDIGDVITRCESSKNNTQNFRDIRTCNFKLTLIIKAYYLNQIIFLWPIGARIKRGSTVSHNGVRQMQTADLQTAKYNKIVILA